MTEPISNPPESPPAGWYPDPQTPGQQRYWDGSAWTASVLAPPEVAAPVPAPAPPAPAESVPAAPVPEAPVPAAPIPSAPMPAAAPTSNNAIVGLVLAILSWFLCPIIAAIAALLVARSSDKEIAASEGRLGGSGLNTATRIIAWINIGVSIIAGVVIGALTVFGLIFAANAPELLDVDPAINARTGLPDGAYVMESVAVRINLVDECTYGDMASTLDGVDVKEVTVYGSGPTQCPDIEEVRAVFFEVEDGLAVITRVE